MKTFVIYTKKKNCPDSKKIIININAYFSYYKNEIEASLDETDTAVMWEIDEAKPIHGEKYIGVETPYGICGLENLSTGCKTVILANHLKGRVISLNLCGMNALMSLFTHVPADNNEYYLTNKYFDFNDKRHENVKINYNKQRIVTFRDFYELLSVGRC